MVMKAPMYEICPFHNYTRTIKTPCNGLVIHYYNDPDAPDECTLIDNLVASSTMPFYATRVGNGLTLHACEPSLDTYGVPGLRSYVERLPLEELRTSLWRLLPRFREEREATEEWEALCRKMRSRGEEVTGEEPEWVRVRELQAQRAVQYQRRKRAKFDLARQWDDEERAAEEEEKRMEREAAKEARREERGGKRKEKMAKDEKVSNKEEKAAAEKNAKEAGKETAAVGKNAKEAEREKAAVEKDTEEADREKAAVEKNAEEAEREKAKGKEREVVEVKESKKDKKDSGVDLAHRARQQVFERAPKKAHKQVFEPLPKRGPGHVLKRVPRRDPELGQSAQAAEQAAKQTSEPDDPKAEAKADTKTEAKTETRAEVKAETRPEPKPTTKPKTRPATESQALTRQDETPMSDVMIKNRIIQVEAILRAARPTEDTRELNIELGLLYQRLERKRIKNYDAYWRKGYWSLTADIPKDKKGAPALFKEEKK